MAMPTRLEVLLHRRKSAAAGPVDKMVSGSAATALANSAPRTLFATMTWLITKADSVSIGGPVNDDGAKVGDVGERRAGYEQVAHGVEKPRGIVVGEKRGGNEAEPFGPHQGRIVDKGSGRGVWLALAAIGSIAIGPQCSNTLGPPAGNGERQAILLVPTAAAAAFKGDGQLAPGEDRHAAAGRSMIAGQSGVFGGDLARFSLQAVAKHDAFVTRLLRAPLGGRQGAGRLGHDAVGAGGKNCVARLWRLVAGVGERARDCWRQIESVFFHDRSRIG